MSHTLLHTCYTAVREGNVPISVSAFHEHVKRMHADRDKLFELEFEVTQKLNNYYYLHDL